MVHKYIQTLLLTLLLSLEVSRAVVAETEHHPLVGDWDKAVGKDGLIRIPLYNPRGHAWFGSLQMGKPLQAEQICVFDNNHALSVVFAK